MEIMLVGRIIQIILHQAIIRQVLILLLVQENHQTIQDQEKPLM
jgi:hypothetical protein